MLKECVNALKSYGKFNQCEYTLQKNNSTGKLELLKNGCILPFPITHLKSVTSKIQLKSLLACSNQGRFWETLQHTPTATRNVYNFHTKMCDWRFIHKARLNLCPLNGAIVWGSGPKECRRCQCAQETANHVLNTCSTQRKNIIKRHNAVRDHIEKWLPNDIVYYKEQRFGNTQPDFVIETSSEIIIADVKITIEDPVAMNKTHIENQNKYEALRTHFANTGKPTHTTTILCGNLGSVSNLCRYLIRRIFRDNKRANSTIRHISDIIVHHSRNQMISHITGKPQKILESIQTLIY